MPCRTCHSGGSCEESSLVQCVSFAYVWPDFAGKQKSPHTHYTCTPYLWFRHVSSRVPPAQAACRTLDRSRQNYNKTCHWCISSGLLLSRSDSHACAAKDDLQTNIVNKEKFNNNLAAGSFSFARESARVARASERAVKPRVARARDSPLEYLAFFPADSRAKQTACSIRTAR